MGVPVRALVFVHVHGSAGEVVVVVLAVLRRDLVEAGSRAEAARRGLQRLEGKEYVVQEGDVLNVRFNV